MYTNEELAALIVKFDHKASWAYNQYCGYCARFLYADDINNKCCKKCKTSTDKAISRAIPFSTSATAIEKLINWQREDKLLNAAASRKIAEIMYNWALYGGNYYIEIISIIGHIIKVELDLK